MQTGIKVQAGERVRKTKTKQNKTTSCRNTLKCLNSCHISHVSKSILTCQNVDLTPINLVNIVKNSTQILYATILVAVKRKSNQ